MNDLDKLKEEIYNNQYFEYDFDTEFAYNVLEDIQKNLISNPILLQYILKCLNNQGILLTTNQLYCIIIHTESHQYPYKKEIHGSFENWGQVFLENPRENDIIKKDIIFDRVFLSREEAENFIKNGEYDDNIKFEKYTIKKL